MAFVARLDGAPSHETVERALTALANLEHRGAAGADARTGDGAGILIQVPDAFFRGALVNELPPAGRYGVAVCFLPRSRAPGRAGACSSRRWKRRGKAWSDGATFRSTRATSVILPPGSRR